MEKCIDTGTDHLPHCSLNINREEKFTISAVFNGNTITSANSIDWSYLEKKLRTSTIFVCGCYLPSNRWRQHVVVSTRPRQLLWWRNTEASRRSCPATRHTTNQQISTGINKAITDSRLGPAFWWAQPNTAVVWRPTGTATWRTSSKQRRAWFCPLISWYENITSFIKPAVHDVSQRHYEEDW